MVIWSRRLRSELYRAKITLDHVFPEGPLPELARPEFDDLKKTLSSHFQGSQLLPLYLGIQQLRKNEPERWDALRATEVFRFIPDRDEYSTIWLDLIFLLRLNRHVDQAALKLYSAAARSRLVGPEPIYTIVASASVGSQKIGGFIHSTFARLRFFFWKRLLSLAGAAMPVSTNAAPDRAFPTLASSSQQESSHADSGSEQEFSVKGSTSPERLRETLGFVVPRFGTGFAGGIEALCRQAASLLSAEYQVEIYTTTATDYLTWSNAMPEGMEVWSEGGGNVRIHRFDVDHIRNLEDFVEIESRLKEKLQTDAGGAMGPEGRGKEAGKQTDNLDNLTQKWIHSQGPISTKLEKQLIADTPGLDAVFFFTIQYSSTLRLLEKIKNSHTPVAVVPAAHPDWTLSLPVVRQNLALVDLWITSTPEEEALLRRTLQQRDSEPGFAVSDRTPGDYNSQPMALPGGVTVSPHQVSEVDLPHTVLAEAETLQGAKFLLYVGRLDPSKGVDNLIQGFLNLLEIEPDWKLVLVGNVAMAIPDHPSLICTGFLPENTLDWLYFHAQALVNPSAYESLSIVLLEAWARGLPTIANGQSEVMLGQTARSGCGYCYRNIEEFVLSVQQLHKLNGVGIRGPEFILENYNDATIAANYIEAAEFLLTSRNDRSEPAE